MCSVLSVLLKTEVKTLFKSDFFWESQLYKESNNFSLNNINLENFFVILITCILGWKINYAGNRS